MSIQVFITGANRGIGLGLVQFYLQRGDTVIATTRRLEAADALLALRDDYPNDLQVKELDVTDNAAIQALAEALDGTPIDILINNAGIYGQADAWFGNTDEEQWLQTFRTNTIAPLKVIEAFVNHVAYSRRRVIASMSSKMGSMDDNTSGGSYVYRSSKAALNAVMKSVAIDLQPRDIGAVILHPGWVKTTMGGPNAEISVEHSAAKLATILDDVTASNAGDFYDIDGQVLPW